MLGGSDERKIGNELKKLKSRPWPVRSILNIWNEPPTRSIPPHDQSHLLMFKDRNQLLRATAWPAWLKRKSVEFDCRVERGDRRTIIDYAKNFEGYEQT